MSSWYRSFMFFFFNDTATTEIYTLSLHDALPILSRKRRPRHAVGRGAARGTAREPRRVPLEHRGTGRALDRHRGARRRGVRRSEEHTSELQSLAYLVCRLLLEKKKITQHLQTRED